MELFAKGRFLMKTIYLSRNFQPIAVSTHKPGDVYRDIVLGECRRLTAKRLCLAGERYGKDSDAFLGLLRAIVDASEGGEYDGRAIESWYGLVGMAAPEKKPGDLHRVRCPACNAWHWALEEDGALWEGGVCGICWSRNYLTTPYSG